LRVFQTANPSPVSSILSQRPFLPAPTPLLPGSKLSKQQGNRGQVRRRELGSGNTLEIDLIRRGQPRARLLSAGSHVSRD
jgi:hypothetical protein